jgi:hypothetical protein
MMAKRAVVSSAVMQIKQAVQGRNIQLLFFLVNKMSRTKFYTSNLENPESGTIVDSKVADTHDTNNL